MDSLIDYDKAKRLPNFGVPKTCPNCQKLWRSIPPPIKIIQEGWFEAKRMAQRYYKTCEFCGYTYSYFS